MKNRRGMWIAGCACAAVSVGGVFVAYAGPLNPPAGAIAPTMNSLGELFAVSGQSVGGITTSVLGPPREVTAMSINGGVQGPIAGEDTIGGLAGAMGVYGFSHELTVPIDPASGQPAGPRVHSPMRVVKTMDKASPKLYQALTTGENLINVQLKWYRIDSAGQEEHYFTVKLTNARVVDMRPFTVPSTNESYRHMEQVSFVYEEIEWTWELEPGNTAVDSWAPPPGG